jgi:ribosomal protein S18 acetylase RimI-like enzyme
MTSLLPDTLFTDPIWHALHGPHGHLAIGAGPACRYRGDVAVFAALAEQTGAAMAHLRSLLAPGEAIWLFGSEQPSAAGLDVTDRMVCQRMALPAAIEPPEPFAGIIALTEANANEMVALTDIAFPGFFRRKTYLMGKYYGVRAPSGELIAMGGERMKLDGYSEISTVCTHPSFRGRGLAENIIWQVVRQHRREGVQSFLHVGKANMRAIALYERLGFVTCREITITRMVRSME